MNAQATPAAKPVLVSHLLCPYVQRAVIALEEKQVDYDRIDIDLANKPAWFLALSPLGKTPLLRVGAHTLFESAVICEYLEDTVAPALHPADPVQRAMHRAWVELASVMLNAIWAFYTAKDDASYAAASEKLRGLFAQVEAALRERPGPYFDGDRFSLVDAAFAPVFRYFDVFDDVSGVDVLEHAPKTRAWRQALAQRPSVRAAVTTAYPELLRQFVIRQEGVLGRRLRDQAAQ